MREGEGGGGCANAKAAAQMREREGGGGCASAAEGTAAEDA